MPALVSISSDEAARLVREYLPSNQQHVEVMKFIQAHPETQVGMMDDDGEKDGEPEEDKRKEEDQEPVVLMVMVMGEGASSRRCVVSKIHFTLSSPQREHLCCFCLRHSSEILLCHHLVVSFLRASSSPHAKKGAWPKRRGNMNLTLQRD